MSNPPPSNPSIEQLILSAAHHVQPSRDLRPRTIEAARAHCQDRRSEQKLGGFIFAVMLMLLISSPVQHYAEELRIRLQMPNSDEIERLAIEYSHNREVGTHFGLSEAFTRLRQSQADRMGQSIRQIH